MSNIQVPDELAGGREFNEYSDLGSVNKGQLHGKGRVFLKNLAQALGMQPGDYDLSSNRGGIAVSGEVTLHSDDLYVQISDTMSGRGLQVMFRSCKSRRDYCGHQNNFASLDSFREPGSQSRVLKSMQTLIATERQRKQAAIAQALPKAPSPAPVTTASRSATALAL